MIKGRDQDKIILSGLIMMRIFRDTGAGHVLVGQKNRFGLACRAGGEIETTRIIIFNVDVRGRR
jgi:hypothetical protein